MTDYGHDLQFGAFVTPTVEPALHAVELAVVADRSGLDIVTFQDHPYNPWLLDTWTLLAFAAARTTRIQLAGNVLNLPLRPAPVLARAVASLDLLSGGRTELGLGAGAFLDGVATMGGPRLSTRQSIDALEEAIPILRAIWNSDRRGGVHADGEHYHVHGARPGPTPAHDIGIWLGAYKPRMLGLTGRLADGSLPSLPYLPDGAASLTAMHALIDEGAESVGRSPMEIRRFLNITGQFQPTGRAMLVGPPRQWAEQLAELTLAYGVSGFILASDDAAMIERYAAEVAPATRELVATERDRTEALPGVGA